MAQDLLVAVDFYGLERLRLMCEKLISESLSMNNIMATLVLVHDRHSCNLLEAACIDYVLSDPDVYDVVEASKGFASEELDNEITKKLLN
jgi:speckle-type POZ protein